MKKLFAINDRDDIVFFVRISKKRCSHHRASLGTHCECFLHVTPLRHAATRANKEKKNKPLRPEKKDRSDDDDPVISRVRRWRLYTIFVEAISVVVYLPRSYGLMSLLFGQCHCRALDSDLLHVVRRLCATCKSSSPTDTTTLASFRWYYRRVANRNRRRLD